MGFRTCVLAVFPLMVLFKDEEEGEEVQPVLGSSIQTWIFFVSFPHLLFPFLVTFLALPAAVGTPATVLVIY